MNHIFNFTSGVIFSDFGKFQISEMSEFDKQSKENFDIVVHQCLLCGCFITSVEGVSRHLEHCKFPDRLDMFNFEQMVNIKFPRTTVAIEKLLPLPSKKRNEPSLKAEVPKFEDEDFNQTSEKESANAANISESYSDSETQESNDNDACKEKITYNCEKCSMSLRSKMRLKVHISLKHAPRPFLCTKCGRDFLSQKKLIDHMKFHESTDNKIYMIKLGNGKWKCTYEKCDTERGYEDSMRKHWLVEHHVTVPTARKGPIAAKKKANSFSKKGNKISKIPDKEKFICPISSCQSRLHNVPTLRKHFILHLENNPYACPVPNCDSQLGALCHFMRHMHWHMGRQKRYECPKCKETYCNQANLRKHPCGQANNRPYPYVKDNQKSSDEINEYLKSHFGRLQSKGFYEPSSKTDDSVKDEFGLIKIKLEDIKMSAIIESDPVFLKTCKENEHFRKLFLNRYSHRRNSKKPSKGTANEKYKCGRCSREFGTKISLKNHHTEVHADRPYKCSLCKHGFMKPSFLEAHMKFHESTDNKIYMKKTENGKWMCTQCDAEFSYNHTLRRHLTYAHNITVDLKAQKQMRSTNDKGPSNSKVSPPVKRKIKNESKSDTVLKLENERVAIKSEDSDECKVSLSSPIIRIKSEPALQLVMISRTDLKNESSCKW